MTQTGLHAISYGELTKPSMPFQRCKTSTAPFTETLWRLREAIEAADFWILQEINPQMLLRRGGFIVSPIRQILFFHPRFLARMLEADSAALLEAPLKLAILELPNGTVQLRWSDPVAAFARYGNPLLADLGSELAAACDEISAMAVSLNESPHD